MLTRLMFIRESSPLINTVIEVTGHGEFVTDSDGSITLSAQLQNKTQVRVIVDGEWFETHVEPKTDAGLYVVDVGRVSHNALLAGGSQTLGDRYTFTRALGRGGMGVVVEARDGLLERTVAIKMLSHELQEVPEARRIFLIEGQALAKLSHPNLVSVYDVAEIDGRAMMVMEFIEGRTLEALLKERTLLPAHQAVEVAIELLGALSYLHEQGTIHRDIKPANLMIDAKHNRLKIIDFGLARSFEQLAARGTQVRGTPGYMAPEQIRGEDLTPATDIYQTGATLYEVFSGRLPFTESIVRSHLEKEPPRIETVLPTIKPEIAEIVHSCLRKTASERPTAAELIAALKAIQAGISAPLVDSPIIPATVTGGLTDNERASGQENPSRFSSLSVEHSSGIKGGAIGIILGLLLAVGGLGAFFLWTHQQKPVTPQPVAEIEVEEATPIPVPEPVEPPPPETAPKDAAGIGVNKAISIALASSDVVAPALLKRSERVERRRRPRLKAAPEVVAEPKVEAAKPEAEPEPVVVAEPEPKPEPKPEPVVVAKPVPKPVAKVAPKPVQAPPPPVIEAPKKKKKKKAAPVSF